MSTPKSSTQNPADIARETFKQLTASRTPPTPQAYKKFYNEIAGIVEEIESKQVDLLKDLLTRTVGLALPTLLISAPELSKEAEALSLLLKKTDAKNNLVDIGTRLKNLCFKIEHLPTHSQPVATKKELAIPTEDPLIPLLSKLLSQTLAMAVGSLLQNEKVLFASTESLVTEMKAARTIADFLRIEIHLKDLCFKIALKGDDASEQLQLLLSLFKLLLENVSSLLEEDNWLRGQVIIIQELITGKIDHRALIEATKNLKEVIYKQEALKDSINQSKGSVKNLMNLFVDRLNVFANTTGWYHEKIATYTSLLNESSSPEHINKMTKQLLEDTLLVQAEAKQSHELMLAAQNEVARAEASILELEKKLADMSEQVQKDQLTGSLNRRGFDEVLEREASRADRRHTPLCLCMMDIDDFKKINDQYGHTSGDGALVHLVNIVKESLRSIDVVARYGGEEFVIIMPETSLKEAEQTMIRVQRELTKHFFMAGREHIVITFSAGVAERHPSEEKDTLIRRADKAMYQAKSEGKNRVVSA